MDAQTLREVMGGTLPGGGYTKLIDGYNAAMRAAHVTTVERAAMFAAQIGHESVGLKYMREIASGSAYEGRRDLGNIHPGDGVRYAGRGPIQLTGRNNYRAFTKWAQANGHTTIDFEAEPHRLEEPHWGFLAASYYWVAARPQINRLADAGDLEGVTRAINGGLNGLADRRARYQRALTYGARLLPEGNESMPEPKVVHPMGPANGTWSETSGYGPRWGTHHNGQDYGAPLGTPIYAVADGIIIEGKDRAPGSVSGFGNWVWQDSQKEVGRDFIYGHMRHNEIYVKRGDRVKAGDLIARVGSEGGSTGPHLHFEVWGPPGRTSGQHEDPKAWLEKHMSTGSTKIAPPAQKGPLMALTDDEQRRLLEKVDRIHHELTHPFQSRYADPQGNQSPFRETLIGYMLELDRKIEDIHINMLPTMWERLKNTIGGKK
ncbi:peptidoglycan DD-metalloendopeptidase family protein [uncultured Corynebacterium sp.]|uniref:peptidoglycan DD-metalloendopeptidase family protein n=1 Tax=uncultured Corynebacterium sp. TaxID=159447 RepID=UPI0025933978|nr:peptidoglycan DD-metalloendopeptidase family protein [uncultured Corynebacterium sp.]